MSIEITRENLLTQIGYPVTEATLSQLEKIISNTESFDIFSKHLLSLNDEVKRFGGIVAMSNSKNYLKVKTDSDKAEEIAAFENILKHWSEKYKVQLQKVDGKNTYYILGHK